MVIKLNLLSIATILALSKGENRVRKIVEEDAAFWDRELKHSTMCKKKNLAVVNGSGDGNYCPGDKIPILSHKCKGGEKFSGWELVYGNAIISDTSASSTTLMMPDSSAEVKAICASRSPCTEYNLSIKNGIGDGDYCPEINVPIAADDCPQDKVFDRWVVLSGDPVITNTFSDVTTLITPNEDSRVEAMCKDPWKLIVDRGRGDGDYFADEIVPIEADGCPVGEEFLVWNAVNGSPAIKNKKSKSTLVTMPDNNARVEAMCTCQKFKLIVEDGNGDGSYCPNESVPIVAEKCQLEEVFEKWMVIYGDPIFSDVNSPESNIRMPDGDVKIVPICKCQEYKLKVKDGIGDGDYCPEEEVPVVAEDCDENEEFERWEIVYGSPKILDPTQADTVVTTSDEDSKVKRSCKCQEYNLQVEDGSGDGDYCPEEEVPVAAEDCDENEEFERWVIVYGSPKILDPTQADTVVTTSDEDSKVERSCKCKEFQVIVDNGTGDGSYCKGSTIKLDETCSEGLTFVKWEIVDGSPVLIDDESSNTDFSMPDEDVRVAALCTRPQTPPPTPPPTLPPTPLPTPPPTPLPTPPPTLQPVPVPTSPPVRTRRPTRNPGATRRPVRPIGTRRSAFPSLRPSEVPSNTPTV